MMNQVGAAGSRSAYPTQPKNSAHDKERDAIKVARTDAFERVGGVRLSEKAQSLLKELQAKYRDTDFIIADYSSDEEASRLLSGGTKEFSVLIDPETLEKMASDESVRAEYEGYIEESRNQLTTVAEQLIEKGASVRTLGASVSNDGTISLFAELEEMSKRRNEQMEEARETAREEAKAEAKEEAKKADEKKADEKRSDRKPYEPPKLTRIFADSADELLRKIFDFYGIDPTAEPAEAAEA